MKDSAIRSWLSLLVTLTSVTGVHGQAPGVTVPTKMGHSFVEAPLMPMPFVRSTVKLGVGVGSSGELDYGTVTLPEGDTLLDLRGELLTASLSFQYQYAVRDWFGVYTDVRVKARTGTDGPSLARTGVTYGVTFEVGWLAQVRETESSVTSASLSLSNRDVSFIDPLGFVVDLANGERPELISKTPSLRVGTALHYAKALNRVLGAYAMGTASFGESLKERQTEWLFGAAGGVSLDLESRGVPIGLGLTGRYDQDASPFGSASGPRRALGLRMTYTRPTDMQLSLLSTFNRVPFTEQADMTITEVGIQMRYYFF